MSINELQQLANDPLSEAGFSTIEAEVEAVLESGSLWERMQFVEFLSQLLAKQGKKIEQQKPEYYDRYQYFWLTLVLKSFTALDPDDQSNLLRQRVLSAIRIGFDPDELVNQFYETYSTDSFIAEHFRSYANDLLQNGETLGSAPIEIEGKKFLPQLKYWILDYTKCPAKVAQRGSLERLNYVNMSPNTRQLTQVQRQYLLQALHLYDLLMNPVPVSVVRPDVEREPVATDAVEFEQEGYNKEEEEDESLPETDPMAIPEPAPEQKSLDVTKSVPKEIPVPQPISPKVQEPVTAPPPVIKPVRDIDKKLEALKQKIKP